MPDIDAAQLLRSLGLEGAADPAALLKRLCKLPGVRQQGVLDSAAAVVAHLRSPAVGLAQQQAGQLLQGCPDLFSWPPEQRAAVLFGELMGAGLAAEQAAQCFIKYPQAAHSGSFAAGLAELAAILAHSQDRDSSLGGPQPRVPAAQRTVAALLQQTPSAVQLMSNAAGYLQQRAAELQQAGFTPADVAALAWDRPELLLTDSAARVARAAAVLQQELSLTAAEVVSLVAKGKPSWVKSSSGTLRERAVALAEVGATSLCGFVAWHRCGTCKRQCLSVHLPLQGFGKAAAAAVLKGNHSALSVEPGVWRRNLRYMAACGVADPAAVLRHAPQLLHRDQAAANFLQRRLMLQRCTGLTAAQLYEQHPGWLKQRKALDLGQWLHFVEQRGGDVRVLLSDALFKPLPKFLAAVGASEQEWGAWAAAHPAAVCPLYRWAQQAAEEEQQRLAAVLPPELRQGERRETPRFGR